MVGVPRVRCAVRTWPDPAATVIEEEMGAGLCFGSRRGTNQQGLDLFELDPTPAAPRSRSRHMSLTCWLATTIGMMASQRNRRRPRRRRRDEDLCVARRRGPSHRLSVHVCVDRRRRSMVVFSFGED